MESNAKAYSVLNKPQYNMGCAFIRSLNLCPGDKVLDMGCGTGELSKFIADFVGLDGEVVGVDPDGARVKLAQEKFKDVPNIKFLVGSSAIGFPHDNEQYYDLHFSNFVFHWVTRDEKMVYLKKAYQCLKRKGRIAIRAGVKHDLGPGELKDMVMDRLNEAVYKALLQDASLFVNVVTHEERHLSHFASFAEFESWFKASFCHDINEIDPDFVKDYLAKFTKMEADETFTLEIRSACITGKKAKSSKVA